MDGVAIPTHEPPWAGEVSKLVTDALGASLANHCSRSWWYAHLLAEHEGMRGEVDDTLLFAATMLHDIGLRPGTVAPVRFEIDGADYAATYLAERGFAPCDSTGYK